MTVRDDAEFWKNQTQSLHRFSNDEFFQRKAAEHAAVMGVDDCRGPVVDLGCGAGELLSFFARVAQVTKAFDYSESMLNSARTRLEGYNMSLDHGELFSYIDSLEVPVWVTSAAVNQYLEPDDMFRFLSAYAQNKYARSLYLFDCVDHLRHALLFEGIQFNAKGTEGAEASISNRKTLRRMVHRILFSSNLLIGQFGQPSRRLGQPGMGLGFLPSFWNDAGHKLNLSVQCTGSREYEYRYHAILRKVNA